MTRRTHETKLSSLSGRTGILRRNATETTTSPTSESACGRLIRRTFAPHELPSLIETTLSGEGAAVSSLLGDDAQTFVDVMNEALDRPDLSSRIRGKCLRSLYRMCGRCALLPTVMKVFVRYDRDSVVLYRGGFGDVWKGEYSGRDVAVKVIRTYSNSDLQKMIGRFCKEVMMWRTLQHPNVLPLVGVMMSESQFAMVSDWMVNGNINDFVKARPHVDRLELLEDVAKGLIYIHSQGMIHGDLKGANILIDNTGHALLADFGLLKIISDPANLLSSSSHTQGGTFRWMSPELIFPEEFGLENSHPTIPSDCYALGMVIYETISGNLPFHKDADPAVCMKVMTGKRPPRGARFTESLWRVLELCWMPQPDDRPSIEDVLQCLRVVASFPQPLPELDEETGGGGGDWDLATDSSSVSDGASFMMATEGGSTSSSGLSYITALTDPPLYPVVAAPEIADLISEAGISTDQKMCGHWNGPSTSTYPTQEERYPTGVLERDAEGGKPKLMTRQLRHSPSPPPEPQTPEETPKKRPTSTTPTTPRSPIFGGDPFSRKPNGPKPAPVGGRPWEGSEPQSWEVFRAIEKKDLVFLMEVRDHAFHVLLKKSGDATPLVHSMRIGKSHSEVTIDLLGAISRWVNHLPDEEVNLPETKVLLRALRTDLKLAIDYGLQSQQNGLIASFMQTSIMSEGEKWVQDLTVAIAIALRAGNDGKPVTTAETCVRRFATRGLGRENYISALEDSVANATADLIMMGAWHCAQDFLPNADPIPTWGFARDDRVHKTFIQELDAYATIINRKAGRRLRRQFRVLRKVMENRSTSNNQKVDVLRAKFDEGPGV